MAPKSVTFRRHDHLVSVLFGDLLSHSYNITFSMFLYLVFISHTTIACTLLDWCFVGLFFDTVQCTIMVELFQCEVNWYTMDSTCTLDNTNLFPKA